MKKETAPVDGNAMIIEDEKDLCFLLSMVLKQNHFQPACAYSINQAKESLGTVKPSIVFLDNHLPDGYGSDFIPVVKKLNPSTKVIMITAYDSQNDINIAMNRGADFFISKPFTAQKINATMKYIKSNRA